FSLCVFHSSPPPLHLPSSPPRRSSDLPTGFIKLNSALSGHNARVARPEGIVSLDYEPELVFVIGKRALGAKKRDAHQLRLVIERSEEHTSELQSRSDLVCRLLLEKKKK